MGIGTSLILITVGAIMRFAITAQGTGFDIQTIGLILMIVGVIGFVVSLVFWNSWGSWGLRRYPYSGRTVVHRTDREVVPPAAPYGAYPGYGYPPGTVPPAGTVPPPGTVPPGAPAGMPRRTTVVEEERDY